MIHLRTGRALPALAMAWCAAGTAALPELEGVVALGASYSVACAALSGGGAACWSNETYSVAPILARTTSGRAAGPVGGLDAPLGRVAVGGQHACAVATDGSLWCWGNNEKGQVGIGIPGWGTRNPARVPTLTAVSDVDAGAKHTCAVAGGGAYCWGGNTSGQLGDGTTLSRDAPVPVTGLAAGVHRIAAGGDGWSDEGFSCALATGAAKCWGANSVGQLGDRSTVRRLTPVPVAGLDTGTTDVAAGNLHACAVHAGAAKCWGRNNAGQLGDGTWVDRAFPVDVANATRNIVAVTAGAVHSCALRDDGAVLCWGGNSDGQLGDGTLDWRTIAAPVVGLVAPAVAIAAGDSGTCALLATGEVQCFGTPLGIGAQPERPKPVDVDAASGVRRLSAGGGHTCGVGPSGGAFCFGNGQFGAIGSGGRGVAMWPTPVTGLQSGVLDIVTKFQHSCARTVAGAAFCWGRGSDGQIGDGTWSDALVAVAVTGLDSGVTDLATGESFTCAVAGGGARCWGSNAQGQLGTGQALASSGVPIAPWGLAEGIERVYAGSAHACALRSGGGLKCWGENWAGALGDGTTVRRYTAVDVVRLNSGARDASLGTSHSCAIDDVGRLWCWGGNWSGQLGDGTQTSRPVPVPVSGLAARAVAVAAGDSHTCALLQGGEVRCWGSNGQGQVGSGATRSAPALVPVPVPLGEPAYGITAGASHSCAILGGDRAKCWGSAADARLGNGDVWRSPVPRTVKAGMFGSTIALSASPSPSTNGQYVTISAHVDTPDALPEQGQVTFADGLVPLVCAGPGVSGPPVVTCSVPLFTGIHELMVSYLGSNEALPSTATLTHVVGPIAGQHCAGFDDVDAADAYCRDVEWLRNRSITLGCAPFTYCPGGTVTRVGMAAFLDRLGGIIGPAVETLWAAPIELWPSEFLVCSPATVPTRDHPGHLLVDAIVSGVASVPAKIELVPTYGGFAIGSAAIATADPARPIAVRLTGSTDLEPGAPSYYVGFRLATDTIGFHLSDVRCIVRTQVFDRTGTYTPFDVPQGARP